MFEFILSLTEWIGIGVSMVVATMVGLLVYFSSHKLISRCQTEDLKDPMSSLFRVVGMLVGLMLSLAFADVVLQTTAIKNAIEREVAAISDTFEGLRHFDSEKTQEIRTRIIDYTQAIIDDDWPILSRNI